MRAWLSPLFLAALLLSLLAHFSAALGDTVWLWWQAESMAEVKTTATKRKLKSQSVDSGTESTAELLSGVTPADSLTITLGRRAPPVQAPPAAKPAVALAAKPIAPIVKPVEIARIEPPPTIPAPAIVPSAPTPAAEKPVAPPTPALPVLAPTPTTTTSSVAPPPTPPEAKATAARMLLDGPFPKKVDIGYVVKGLVSAEHHWLVSGRRYEITTRGSVFGKSIEWRSEGELDQHGLKPTTFKEYRDNITTSKYEIDFDWVAHKVRYGEPGQQKDAELQEGGQDAFSAAYQFALQGDKLPSFTMQIITGRNVYQVPFELKGEAKLTLSGQSVNTMVLYGVNQQRRFSFYLAPDWHNLPVRITFDDNGKVTDLVAVSLEVDGKVILTKPVRTRDR